MPQNFRTRSVGLNQAWLDVLESLPGHKPERESIWCDEYRVVDLRLRDGRHLEGVLAIDDDLMVHEDEPEFEAEDIVEMTATPADRIPDFSITDEDAVWDLNANAERVAIEWGNSKRLDMFGPEKVEPDWRSEPIEKCWDEAILMDRYAYSFEEIPCGSGPNRIRLVPGGIEIHYRSVSRDAHETKVVKPVTSKLWSKVLRMVPEVDPAFTPRHLLELLDLPEDIAREVYCRTMMWESNTFADWIAIAKVAPAGPDTDIEYLEVYNTAGESSGEYWFGVDCHGVSKPLTAESREITDPAYGGHYKVGDRINYALDFTPLPKLLDLPIRVNDELKVPVKHDELMRFFRGPMRDFRVGKISEEPEYPWALQARKAITLGEMIGAIFTEVSCFVDDDHRDSHPLWQEIMESAEQIKADITVTRQDGEEDA